MVIVNESEQYLKDQVVKNPQKYSELMKKLILEGLIKMLEPVVLVR
jgi:hypothetical protein